MTAKLSQLSVDEFRDIVETAVEQKLIELIGDPDDGLVLKESIRNRLLRQRENVQAGERGVSLEDAADQLGLE